MEEIEKTKRQGAAKGQTERKRKFNLKLSQPIDDLVAPENFPVAAKDFFDRHKEHLIENDLLSIADLDCFLELCKTYSLLKYYKEQLEETKDLKLNRIVDKLESTFAKGCDVFCLNPKARKAAKITIGNNPQRFKDKKGFKFAD